MQRLQESMGAQYAKLAKNPNFESMQEFQGMQRLRKLQLMPGLQTNFRGLYRMQRTRILQRVQEIQR